MKQKLKRKLIISKANEKEILYVYESAGDVQNIPIYRT